MTVQVHTRKLDRLVAHKKMRDAGMSRVNEGRKYKDGKQRRSNSYFSSHWRDYVSE